ncbi:uncharacterized protein [Oryza sativa Japonica Group]|uniref:Uncharacterized protein n=2 Tax=Oryza sativa TaxID=4530 RepID=Q2QUE6_ORYSJ|nr:hypothetical protein LOC_Os12g16510 [Oryza sativa Japonica Group]AGL08230.1 ABA-responsive C3HC4 ring finger ZF3 [Oryza sativa]
MAMPWELAEYLMAVTWVALGRLQPSLLLQELRECQHLDSTTVAASASATGSGSPDIEGMAQADFFFGPELDDLMQQLGDGDTGQKGMLPASSSLPSGVQRRKAGGAGRSGRMAAPRRTGRSGASAGRVAERGDGEKEEVAHVLS